MTLGKYEIPRWLRRSAAPVELSSSCATLRHCRTIVLQMGVRLLLSSDSSSAPLHRSAMPLVPLLPPSQHWRSRGPARKAEELSVNLGVQLFAANPTLELPEGGPDDQYVDYK